MNTTEIAQRLSVRLGLTQAASKALLAEVVDVFRESFEENRSVRIKGFGSFKLRQRAARTAHNPRTGERLEIPARKTVVFAPSQSLKADLN